MIGMSNSSSSQSSPHTSDYTAYVEQTAQLLGIDLREAYRDNVIDQFHRVSASAQQVMTFPLPANIEIAPVFKP